MIAAPSALASRLVALGGLDAGERASLAGAERHARTTAARRELIAERPAADEWRGIVAGWAYRQRILIDGRRQVLGFLLPGDLIPPSLPGLARSPTTIVTATSVTTCILPRSPGFARAGVVHAALEERYLHAHLTRIGRMSAYERIVDWLLEAGDRSALAGGRADRFRMPVTQELMADTLGLTSVHINRMLQAIRHDGLVAVRSGEVTLLNRQRLEALVDYSAPFVPDP